ncbi:MAG: LytTR family transcriptional regulator DNA-binding domain-containing protein [Candidatus Riflemargulisbacteria bacterium]
MRFSYIIIDENDETEKQIIGLFENFPKYFCAGIIKDNQNAIDQIIKLKPQLVFYTIPTKTNENTFTSKNIAELFQYSDAIPYFIAISKSENKALEAIQSGASDFIIEPMKLNVIGKSLFKFEKRTPPNAINAICIKSYSDYQFVALQDIVYLKADNNTTDIKLHQGKIINAYKTLKHFENTLPFYFLRIHKSYIVNIHYVSRIHFSKSKCYMNYNEILPFSINYRDNIDAIVRKINI